MGHQVHLHNLSRLTSCSFCCAFDVAINGRKARRNQVLEQGYRHIRTHQTKSYEDVTAGYAGIGVIGPCFLGLVTDVLVEGHPVPYAEACCCGCQQPLVWGHAPFKQSVIWDACGEYPFLLEGGGEARGQGAADVHVVVPIGVRWALASQLLEPVGLRRNFPPHVSFLDEAVACSLEETLLATEAIVFTNKRGDGVRGTDGKPLSEIGV
mmetsp:Transcript_117135/g.203936  ORF Transcript_117135/g.203936 Transcript_117135/m.203936 type:complete len:209 (-) Transcript_117135:242-868(-)